MRGLPDHGAVYARIVKKAPLPSGCIAPGRLDSLRAPLLFS